MDINAFTMFSHVDQVFATQLADEIFVLNPDMGEYHRLNLTAAYLWEWLKEPHSAESLSRKLSESFDCTTMECQADVLVWLTENYQKNLLQIIPEANQDRDIPYLPPQTNSFDHRSTIQGSNNSFQTDNFEMGS